MSSQSGQKVLRIGLIQNGKIIEERVMRSEKPVTIGQALKKNTFVVPASALPKSFTVFDVSGGKYILQFTSEMSGRVYLGDGVRSLEDLIQQGKAKKTGSGYAVPLPSNARGKVVLGEVTLLFQFVTAPPPRPKPVLPASMRGGWVRGNDPVITLVLAISAILQIGFVAWLETQDWPEPLDEGFTVNDRFVRIMVDKKDDEPPPPEEPEPEEDGDGEGEVAEEAPPTPAPKGSDEPDESDGKTPEELAEQKARERTMKNVEEKTLLGVLGSKGGDGPSIVDSLVEGAGSSSVEEVFSGAKGVEYAAAGVERSGLRRGGSPDGDGVGARAGIDDLGSTKGASDAKKGVKTGEMQEKQVKAKKPRIQDPSDVAGTGTLDSKAVAQAIRRRNSAIQNCYERELRRNNKAGGRVVVNITITARGPRGAISDARVVKDDVGGGVGQCVANELKRLRLPKPEGGDVMMNIPFVFQPAG